MDREAKNISYKKFLISNEQEYRNVTSHHCEIPEFQRSYVWKKSQIEEMINAIDNNEQGYYLGNIVIVKDSSGNGVGKIVDGQQRLITLSLVSFVLLEYVKDNKLRQELEEQIWRTRDNVDKRIIFKKQILDEVYSDILNKNAIDASTLNKAQIVLYKSYESIKNLVQAIVPNKKKFAKKILGLEFVVIRTFTEEEAYLLFEGLNSTGLSLSAVELTKNAILGKIKEIDQSELSKALEIWNKIETRFEDINLSWFLKMLRSQWFYIDGYVTNPNLFKRIKEIKIQNTDIDILMGYLNRLDSDSIKYLKLRGSITLNKDDFNNSMHEPSWKKIKRILFETSKLKLDQVYSVYLSLWKYGDEQYNDFINNGRKFKQYIEKIWAFIFLVKFSDISPSKYERRFANLAYNISRTNSHGEFKRKMEEFFVIDLYKIASSIDKTEFAKRVTEEVSTKKFDESFIKFILEEYLGVGFNNENTLEHIIPKKDYSNWPNINDSLNLEYVEAIGNLTLLSEKANQDAGSKWFSDKVRIYNKSGFSKNKSLDDYKDGFESGNPIENAVKLRGIEVGETLYDKYLSDLK